MIGLSPVSITKFFGAKLGSAVGVSTSVPENPFNKLAGQLKQKEEELALREQELNLKAEELDSGNNSQDLLIIVLGIGIVVLFALVLLNYYLDYRRRKNEQS